VISIEKIWIQKRFDLDSQIFGSKKFLRLDLKNLNLHSDLKRFLAEVSLFFLIEILLFLIIISVRKVLPNDFLPKTPKNALQDFIKPHDPQGQPDAQKIPNHPASPALFQQATHTAELLSGLIQFRPNFQSPVMVTS
jgi:hypothetical protein